MKRMKRKKGDLLLDAVISLILFTGATLAVLNFLKADATVTLALATQDSVRASAAFMESIYKDWKEGNDLTVSSTKQTVLMTFVDNDGKATTYSYDGDEGYCFNDGIKVFRADAFEVENSGELLYIKLTLKNRSPVELSLMR